MTKLRLEDDVVEFAAYEALKETGLASDEQRPLARKFWATFTEKVKKTEAKMRIESAKSVRDGFLAGAAFGIAFAAARTFLFR